MMAAENFLEWVAETPFLLAFLIIAIPATLVSLFGIFLLRISYSPLDRMQGSVARAKVNYMAETYAVVLGLFLVTAFEMYQEMETTINTEALSVRALHQLVETWPDDIRNDIQGALQRYTDTVIDEEWPLMAFEDWSQTAQQHLDELFRAVGALSGTTVGAQGGAIQAEQLARQIAVSRADRLTGGPGKGLAHMLSYVLLVATFVALALPWFIYTPYFVVHAVLGTWLVVVFIAIIVFSVKMMYPFAGELAMAPEQLEAFREMLLNPARAGAKP